MSARTGVYEYFRTRFPFLAMFRTECQHLRVHLISGVLIDVAQVAHAFREKLAEYNGYTLTDPLDVRTIVPYLYVELAPGNIDYTSKRQQQRVRTVAHRSHIQRTPALPLILTRHCDAY